LFIKTDPRAWWVGLNDEHQRAWLGSEGIDSHNSNGYGSKGGMLIWNTHLARSYIGHMAYIFLADDIEAV
jgi:hypothetical protein